MLDSAPPASTLAAEQSALVARLSGHVQQDERVRAAWLEGSLGRGDADPYSDIDLHVLVDGDDLATFTDNVTGWLAPVASWAYHKKVFGSLYHLVTDAGQRVDVMFHEGETASVPLAHVQILKEGDRLSDAPTPSFDAARSLPADVTEFWRVILLLPVALGRGELLRAWQGGIGYAVSTLINLLVRARGNPQALGAKKLNVQMRPDDRARLESLLALPRFDAENIARVTLSLAALMRDLGPECCETLGQPYPTEWEGVVLAHLHRELPSLGMGEVLTETLGQV